MTRELDSRIAGIKLRGKHVKVCVVKKRMVRGKHKSPASLLIIPVPQNQQASVYMQSCQCSL